MTIASGAARSALESRRRQPEQREVLAHGRQEQAMHPLVLHAEHHDDVRAVDGFVERRRQRDAETIESGGHERGRPAGTNRRAHARQQQRIRSEHPAVRQVADDRDRQPGKASFPFENRERVEQRLRRMLVHAVAGVDDAAAADA
jgi:hypothetical protein